MYLVSSYFEKNFLFEFDPMDTNTTYTPKIALLLAAYPSPSGTAPVASVARLDAVCVVASMVGLPYRCYIVLLPWGVRNGGRRRRPSSTWKTERGGRHAASDEQIAGRFHALQVYVREDVGPDEKRRIKYFALFSLSSDSLAI